MGRVHCCGSAAIDWAKANLICTLSPCSWNASSLSAIIHLLSLSLLWFGRMNWTPSAHLCMLDFGWNGHALTALCQCVLFFCGCSWNAKIVYIYTQGHSPSPSPPAFKFRYSLLDQNVYCISSAVNFFYVDCILCHSIFLYSSFLKSLYFLHLKNVFLISFYLPLCLFHILSSSTQCLQMYLLLFRRKVLRLCEWAVLCAVKPENILNVFLV